MVPGISAETPRGFALRFDDMAATVIAQAAASPDARRAGWLQLVDLAAQGRADSDIPGAVYACLRDWRSAVPLADRQRAARAIAGMAIPTELFRFFAGDSPAVAAPLIAAADYPAVIWRELLPKLSPPMRALLRHREDLAPDVRQALASFGASDRMIAAPAIEAVAAPEPVAPDFETLLAEAPEDPAEAIPANGGARIRDLVNRIEAYRRDRPVPFLAAVPTDVESAPDEPAERFRFETASDGMIIWIEGAPRGALIGLSIAAAGAEDGVDGHVTGAFRQRAPFRDARLTVAGAGEAAGEWRISAVPFFTPQDGRFTGYRGTARRPRIDEAAHPIRLPGLYGSGFRPEALRQLVHELRTPLNAILGFAEMIDGQILGPAARDYRARAHEIRGEARKLLAAVDDLDTAARADSDALQMERAALDGGAILGALCAGLAPLTDERGVHLRIAIAPDLPLLEVDPVTLERMYGRLLSSAIAVSEAGETLAVTLGVDGAHCVALGIQRPAALLGQTERALLDPGYSPDGDWPDAPLLGLGFALRLVRNLASAAHGSFAILPETFVLTLPALAQSVAAEEGSR